MGAIVKTGVLAAAGVVDAAGVVAAAGVVDAAGVVEENVIYVIPTVYNLVLKASSVFFKPIAVAKVIASASESVGKLELSEAVRIAIDAGSVTPKVAAA